jgi:GMP synthase-like glutamine amidotransferase
MKRKFLVLQHTPWERPGRHLVNSSRKRRIGLNVACLWQEPVPDVSGYDAIVVLGGTPNVSEEDRYPYLRDEKEAIRKAIELDKPCLGFCLGHQLLGDALGARVEPNFCRSIGFIQGQLTRDGKNHPVFNNLPNTINLFKWHSQAVVPPFPKEMEILATSADCQVESFSLRGRPHIVGFQFDNYAAAYKDICEWIEGDRDWLEQSAIDCDALRKTAREQEQLMGAQFELIFDNFVHLIYRE